MIDYGMPFDEYLALEGMNASTIKSGMKSMKHMKSYMDNGIDPTPAMQKGSLIHSAILEPELLDATVVTYDGIRRGNDWKEFQAENEGMTIAKPSEMVDVYGARDSVWSNEKAIHAIKNTAHEVCIQWDTKLIGKCKARMDGYNPESGMLLEVKSTVAVDPYSFSKTCYNMGTHLQIGWIKSGLNALGLKLNSIVILAVEQKRPWDCVTYEPDTAFIEQGEMRSHEIARQFKTCSTIGIFDGICEEGSILTLPSFAMGNKPVELTIGGEKVEV